MYRKETMKGEEKKKNTFRQNAFYLYTKITS